MNLIWRHTLRSTAGNFAQTLVVLLTVVLCAALIFVGFSMSDLFYDMTRAEYVRNGGEADILVGSHTPSSETFSLARLEAAVKDKGGVARIESFLKLAGIAKTDRLTMTAVIEATDLERYFSDHTLQFAQRYTANDLPQTGLPAKPDDPTHDAVPNDYRAAVIGASTAEKYGVQAGDVLSVYLATYNYYAQLRVEYIALDEGVFSSPASNVILTDFRSVGNLGQVNAAYLTLDGSVGYDEYVEYLQRIFPSVGVGEGDSDTYVRSISDNNTMLLAIGVMLIVALMALILATSYLIIGRNRVGELVIFKAAGAAPLHAAAVLFAEVLWLAVTGALGGLLLGRAALGLAGYLLLPPSLGIRDKAWKYLVSFLLAVLVTVAAASGTVIGMSRKSIRELTADNAREARRPNYLLGALSALLLTAAAVGVHFTSGALTFVLMGVLVVALALFIAFATGAVLQGLGALAVKAGARGVLALAARTARRNKSVHTLAAIAAAFITFAFLVVQVIGIVDGALVPSRSRFSAADYVVTASGLADKQAVEGLEARIRDGYGIAQTGYLASAGMRWVEDEDRVVQAYGLSDYALLEALMQPRPDEDLRARWFAAEHPIVLTRDMALRWGLDVGDTFLAKPTNEDFEDARILYTVVGVDERVTEWDQVAFARYDDTRAYTPEVLYLAMLDENARADAEAVFLGLRGRIEEAGIAGSYALPFDEWAYGATNQSLSGVHGLLELIQIAVYFVGLVGVVNLSVAAAMDRRREMRVYRMTGMDGRKRALFALCEGGFLSLSALIVGVLTSFALNQILSALGAILDKYLAFPLFPWQALVAGGVGLVLFTAIWLGAMLLPTRKEESINERL